MPEAIILKDYKVNQFGMLIYTGSGDQKIIPWHSILLVSKSKKDVQISITFISMTTVTLRVTDQEFMNKLFDQINELSNVAV